MNRKELIDQIVAKMSEDKELLQTIGELVLDLDHCEIAEEQKPDTMYLLTGKVRVKSDSPKPQYHYHPVIKECLFDRGATGNVMVCSTNLLELQRKSMGLAVTRYYETAFVAVSMEMFRKLQRLLDEMVEAIMRNTRHAAEYWMKNSAYAAENALVFSGVYETLLYELMCKSNSMLGAALNDENELVEKINSVSYTSAKSGVDRGLRYSRYSPCGNCREEDDCADFDDEDDEDWFD